MLLNDLSCSTTTGTAPQVFASAVNFFAATQCFFTESIYQNDLEDQEIFDFIIVGGGSAGSVVAHRLSEIQSWKILLLEAGLEPPIESDIPKMHADLYQTKYDWEYYTENDGVRHQGLKRGSVYWPRGKMLGGGSSMNGMIYIRGQDHDFQKWADAGNPNWIPENVNYYFRKAESYQNMELLKDHKIRQTYGTKGPLVVNTINSTYRDITNKVLESWDHIGFNRVKDINTAKFEGSLGISGIFPSTAANGRRSSTYRTYLEPIKNRDNLKIVTNAFVTKVLIDKNKVAFGVNVDIDGTKKTFYANMEVIISAGTINTPQLLMLSGIGPREHLKSHNILCHVNSPAVGKNLHDHNLVSIPIYGDEPSYRNDADQQFEVIKYMYNKTGELAQQNTVSDVTALYSSNQNKGYPEYQNLLLLFWNNTTSGRQVLDGFKNDIRDSYLEFNREKTLFDFAIHLLHPYSRGSIYLKTSNPFDHPIIDANYFGDQRDLDSIVLGIKMLTEVVNTPYFKSINAFVHRVNIPQCNEFDFLSDLYWKCFVINTSVTVYHPVGTAKMGPNPIDSVVDNNLKVYGVKKLRVIDASIMPSITSGNTNAPTIMIGEMGSDIIKTEYIDHYWDF